MSTGYPAFSVEDGDELYALLLEAHRGLDDRQSLALNARLVLLLCARVGDLALVRQAVADARASLEDGGKEPAEAR